MLALKLLLVPFFLLLLSLAGRHFGPSLAGWLAGLPVVAGPILFILAVENGAAFAAGAASASAAAVFASVSFSLAYAHLSQRFAWHVSLVLGLVAWLLAALLLALLPADPFLGLAVAILTLLVAPRLFPVAAPVSGARHASTVELVLRMAAGAVLTVAVTMGAGVLGSLWSGMLAVFPVLGLVLAVFSHRTSGAAFSSALLRAMATGLYSFAAFCATLALALPRMPLAGAFGLAIVVCLGVQAGTIRRLGGIKLGGTCRP
jgi:hypothetical protein